MVITEQASKSEMRIKNGLIVIPQYYHEGQAVERYDHRKHEVSFSPDPDEINHFVWWFSSVLKR